MLDLLLYLFTCTDKAFRHDHYDSLIQIYYKAFREHVEQLGEDANKILPFTAFLRQLKKFGRYGIMMAITIIPVLCIAQHNITIINNDTEESNKDALDAYNKRMGDAIRDAIRMGYI